MKGIFAGILTLIVVQALGTGHGPEQGGALLVWLSKGVEAALSQNKAAIPRAKKKPAKKSSTTQQSPAKPGEIAYEMPRNPQVGTGTVYV